MVIHFKNRHSVLIWEIRKQKDSCFLNQLLCKNKISEYLENSDESTTMLWYYAKVVLRWKLISLTTYINIYIFNHLLKHWKNNNKITEGKQKEEINKDKHRNWVSKTVVLKINPEVTVYFFLTESQLTQSRKNKAQVNNIAINNIINNHINWGK